MTAKHRQGLSMGNVRGWSFNCVHRGWGGGGGSGERGNANLFGGQGAEPPEAENTKLLD